METSAPGNVRAFHARLTSAPGPCERQGWRSLGPAPAPLPSPEKPQTHFLLGKFLGPLHAVIVALRLQVDVQQHAQALQLVRQELVAGPGAAQLLVAHIDLTLHGLWVGKPETQHHFQASWV